MQKIQPPFLGAAYYPEDWDFDEMQSDIGKMLDVGLNVVRIGEFAWRKMEPQDGVFDFEWLHMVVDRLKAAGLGVVLGTPTAVPPIWLTKKYPDMFIEFENGRCMQHSGRRQACSNHPVYLRYASRIVEKLAMEFGHDDAIIGWQIDNEIYPQNGIGCFCPNCVEKYHEHLKKKFGTIEEMNRRLNLNIFSQAYDSFDEVPPPRDTWINPHLKQEYIICSAQAHIRFVAMQADILHRYTKAPIGTDQMPINGIDYREMHRPLDVIQFNHYNTPDNLWECCLWFDYLRTMKDTPFWNTETATCFTGAASTYGSIKPDGFCYANSFLPIALGGEANLYWPWRTHWAGQELTHGAVLDTSGRPMYSTEEVKRVSEDFKKAADFLNHTKVDTSIAVHFSSLNWNMFQCQSVVGGFSYDENLKNYFYKPLIESGLRPDVIDAQADLTRYKLIFTPLMLTLEEHHLSERIAEWVKNGGVWIAGPMTDIRTEDGTKYTDRLHGMIENLTSAEWKYWFPDCEHQIHSEWSDGEAFTGNWYYEVFSSKPEADHVLITKGHKAVIGSAVLQVFRVGKGWVYLLGTLPDKKDMRRLIAEVCGKAEIACQSENANSLIVSPRIGDHYQGVIIVEIGGTGGVYDTERKMHDILSDRIIDRRIHVNPYEVLVLEECENEYA